MQLADVIAEAGRYDRTAYLGTVTPAGRPHVTPVVVNWHDDRLLTFVSGAARKVANVRAEPAVTVHYAVSGDTSFDSLIVDGTARIVDTTAERVELWDAMGYELDAFEPGGPESDGHVFIDITPTSALVLRRYGLDGREVWSA